MAIFLRPDILFSASLGLGSIGSNQPTEEHQITEPQLPDGEELEGIDETESVGWDEFPLNSVFVRTEQRTVIGVVKRIQAGRYDLNPEFQRDFVWPVDKQSRLIESCLMRIPLPAFYVAERYELLAKKGAAANANEAVLLPHWDLFLHV